MSPSVRMIFFAALCLQQIFAELNTKVIVNKIGIPPPDSPNKRAATPAFGWFEQKVDHFNHQDNRTWQMRYLNNSQFFQTGGPIICYLGGEWAIHPGSLMTGQVFDLAHQHDGYMFYIEHRYYGESNPTKDYTTENLKWLTTDQALEDFATFIAYQKSLPQFKNSKVIVIGGSYSATVATWMRLKYPHLIDIAYSSSAPLLAVADFYEYLEVVGDAIASANQTCANVIREANQVTEELMKTPEGRKKIGEAYQVCNPSNIGDEPHRSHFFTQTSWIFSGIVQYAKADDLDYYCRVIISSGNNSFDRLTGFIRAYLGSSSCIGDYDNYIQLYSNTAITGTAYRQWFYQTCTEYGFHQTQSSSKQPFGNNTLLPFYIRSCKDLFGKNFGEEILNAGIARTNLLYGGTNPKVSYLLSVHGTIDPWHRLGVLKNLSILSPAIVIKNASHCQDLSSINEATDTPQMVEAKTCIQKTIALWLWSLKN